MNVRVEVVDPEDIEGLNDRIIVEMSGGEATLINVQIGRAISSIRNEKGYDYKVERSGELGYEALQRLQSKITEAIEEGY